MKQRAKNQFIEYFDGRALFSRQELYAYYLDTEGEMKEGTFGWRIFDLKQKNILREVRKGWYTVDVHPFYSPAIESTLKELAKLFTKNFRDTRYSVWNLNWLNEFTVHQFNSTSIRCFSSSRDGCAISRHFMEFSAVWLAPPNPNDNSLLWALAMAASYPIGITCKKKTRETKLENFCGIVCPILHDNDGRHCGPNSTSPQSRSRSFAESGAVCLGG